MLTGPLRQLEDALSSMLRLRYDTMSPVLSGVRMIFLAGACQLSFSCPEGVFEMFDAILPFMEATMIPESHLALLFLSKQDVAYLKNTLRMLTTLVLLNEFEVLTDARKVWDTVLEQLGMPFLM